jgi:hypothetical protein
LILLRREIYGIFIECVSQLASDKLLSKKKKKLPRDK